MAKEKRKRKKVKRRALSLFLAAALVVSGINLPASAVTVYAEETSGNPEIEGGGDETDTNIDSGTCGTNVTWTYDKAAKKLVISPTGKNGVIDGYSNETGMPWNQYREEIEEIVIEDGEDEAGVSTIGLAVFSQSTALKRLTISDSVRKIDYTAFKGCAALQELVIPKNVQIIEHSAFRGCGALTNITVDEQNPTFSSGEGYNAIIKTADNTLVRGCSQTMLPEGVTGIGKYAF